MSLVVYFIKVFVMHKILFNFFIIGTALVGIQGASAVKLGNKSIDERDVNTQVLRVPSAPFKTNLYSKARKIAAHSDGRFRVRGNNMWIEDPRGIALPKPVEEPKLKRTVAFQQLVNCAEQELQNVEMTEQKRAFLDSLIIKDALNYYNYQNNIKKNVQGAKNPQNVSVPKIIVTFCG